MKAEAFSLYKHKGELSLDLPDFVAESVLDIDFKKLKAIGVEHILLDLDQTLKRVGAHGLEMAIINTFRELNTAGNFASINVVTNNSRARRYANTIGAKAFVPYFDKGRFIRKPNPKFFQKVLNDLKTTPTKVVMIGDKVYFDIRGGNTAGMVTVLVKPLGRDFIFDKLLRSRVRERKVLTAARETIKHLKHKS